MIVGIDAGNYEVKVISKKGADRFPSDNPFIQYKNAKEQTALLMTLVDSINSDDASFTARMVRSSAKGSAG